MSYKVKIPETLKEITLEMYQRWDKVEQGSYFSQQKAVEIFCNVPLPTVAKMRHKDVEEIYGHIVNMLNDEPRGMERFFTVAGQEFGFIPNFSDMTSGEYVDLSTYLGDVSTYHNAMAVLFRPVTLRRGEKYLIEEYESSEKYAYLMKNITCDKLFGAIFFFLNTLTILKNDLVRYLKKMSMNSPEMRDALQRGGVGTQHFNQLLDSIQQDWKPSQGSPLKVS